jgi:hypothetical protein
MGYRLQTIGHATLLFFEDGEPLVATDPWLIGSVYWRSWWLERYPDDAEIDLVRRARHLYVTHSHPDHFHWPSLRRIGPRRVLHPRFPRYGVPAFLEQHGYPSETLEPWQWYAIGRAARIASVPVPVDDSILVIDCPAATIVNLNDSSPIRPLIERVRRELIPPGKPVVVLRSYSPASAGSATYVNGTRTPLKSKRDFVDTARRSCEWLGATHFVPFASQAFFDRADSRWANELKVTYEDLARYWPAGGATLCQPFIDFDLDAGTWRSNYAQVTRRLDDERRLKVVAREAEEQAFQLPDDFDAKLKAYHDDVAPFRWLYRHGIGWRLTTSGQERYYDTRTRRLEHAIPAGYDLTISVPDRVLAEALDNGILTDLGITMLIRVDSQVRLRRAYAAFMLMGLRDYGHLASAKTFAEFLRFYLPYVVPGLRHLPLWSTPLGPGRVTRRLTA